MWLGQVRGLDKKRHRWVVPHPEEHLGETTGNGGKWAQLSAVDQEKYIKMHNGVCECAYLCVYY